MKNKIVLIGMPGCGKTTIGKMLSKELNLKFFDMDDYIEKISSQTVTQLFEDGEENFRNFETLACKELAEMKNALISSGGGIIKRIENIEVLKKESWIIFIDRPIQNILEDVDISGRPLLKDGKERLIKLYEERYDLYKKVADEIIKNDDEIREAINQIKTFIKFNILK
ncbi:shikimate kinase [Clostridium uliginosum]|uniref:Shikimate kinase n=1 Tax=Clostridium uliginosum TaxID=119641 RepID=A0A1I1Q0G5_9CLOT|nr:shikimate kinase [Clostridium uliginosum]SFD15505.1 shikimate kinase [Clostridium uliginosum]